mmetsp:Transcript_16135/g.26872  ORF Transcript_16135/g.26872 Transcript_16135/m.26872 type:complete len:157 (-) Transcript_16135:137-607(-)|eukprot:CAMPEP_0197726626 /NCGR_PEP_ID=MMETSP1434-20131217/16483_1 /TAXON_ID=265543 /ORGANISM="Minutocellus polymorphus, Strain CCMP3303" /LENGTH=156 /DNA_ID=CAMNT_0043312619 /DNA_START=92 /DNA_END=562 /DNA_ORIENTATION=-
MYSSMCVEACEMLSTSYQPNQFLNGERPNGMMPVDVVEKSVLIVSRENFVAVTDAIEEMVDTINVDLGGIREGTNREDEFLLEAGWSFPREIIAPVLLKNELDLHDRFADVADAGSGSIGIGGSMMESSEVMAADRTNSPVGVRSKRCGNDLAVKD